MLCLLLFRRLNQGSKIGIIVVVDGKVNGGAFVVVELGGDWYEGVFLADAHAGEDAFKFFVGDDNTVFEVGEGGVVFAV